MFPLEEVKDYLSNVLGLSNVDQLLTNPDKHEVVTTILQAHVQIQPFHNVTLLALDYEDRHRPTWKEIKSAMFRKEGGLCYQHHYLFYEMLKTLKYNASLLTAVFLPPRLPFHLVILLKHLVKEGDLYLLDVGTGYPTFQLICLDFQKESPTFCESFIVYKYIKHEGCIVRVHKGSDKGENAICLSTQIINGWKELYKFSFDDEVFSIAVLDDIYEKVFTDRSITPFHDSLRWVCFPNFRARILVDKTVLEENFEHKLEKKELKNTEEIVKAMHDLSPVFDDYIKPALNNLKLFDVDFKEWQ